MPSDPCGSEVEHGNISPQQRDDDCGCIPRSKAVPENYHDDRVNCSTEYERGTDGEKFSMKMFQEVGSGMVNMLRLVEVDPMIDFSTKIHVRKYIKIPLAHWLKTHDVSATDFTV